MESLKHSKGTRRRTKLGKIGSPLDHKLKQGKWGEIKLGELFEIKTTKGVNIDRLTVGDNYDYVTRTSKEQGILQKTGSIPGLPANAKNSISLGLLQMDFFVRERPWYAGQFVRKIVPKLEMNRNSLLFFATILNKQKKRFLNVLVRDVDSLFSDTAVKLPLLEDGSVDFERIDFLIRELEEERIRELEAYLKAAGLNNTELTSAEKQAINAITNPSRGGGNLK